MATMEASVRLESSTPPGVIRLVESNGFYRAYNHSAYLFHSCITQYKVTRKFIKSLNASVVYTGFPKDKLLDKIGGREHCKNEAGFDVILKPEEIPDEAKFQAWMESVPEDAPENDKARELPLTGAELCRTVCARLKAYPLESRTPVEAMIFLSSLREELSPREKEKEAREER